MARSGRRGDGGAKPPADAQAAPGRRRANGPRAATAATPDEVIAAPPSLPPTVEPAAGRPPGRRGGGGFVFDRTLVLFIGIAVGVTIGLAFAGVKLLGGGPAPAPQTVAVASSSAAAACAAAEQGSSATDCAQPFSPRLVKTLAKGDDVTIGVFGDSFGEGIWAALYWTLPKSQHYDIIKFAERSTGFTRYQSLNLEDKAASDLASQPIDIAVISFGANDTQGIVDNGHVYPLLSAGWKQAYAARVARYVALLRAEGAMVYWVGLPKMRSTDFDGQIVAMNAFYSDEMAKLDVPFFPTEALSVDDRGQYNDHLVDPKTHKEVLMRASDGIHMSIPGYERITGPLVDRIKAYVERSRQIAAAEGAQTQAASQATSSGPPT